MKTNVIKIEKKKSTNVRKLTVKGEKRNGERLENNEIERNIEGLKEKIKN